MSSAELSRGLPAATNAEVPRLRDRRSFGLAARQRLVTLCYHRVGAPDPTRFYGYHPNCSATAERFRMQMRILKAAFTPISLSQLTQFLENGTPLPDRPALVTFDDGYKDNGDVAWPILREMKIPAVVFLATDHIGTCKPFLWDYAAYCFETSRLERADIPLLGPVRLGELPDRRRLTSKWVREIKSLPSSDRQSFAEALARSLRTTISSDDFANMYLTWNDVERLKSEGLEFGGHTHSHPILTKLDPQAARAEIEQCQDILSQRFGHAADAFAYPNGSSLDFSSENEKQVTSCGFKVAFSLNAGVLRLSDICAQPTAIRRLYLARDDGAFRFMAKIARLVIRGE